MIFKNIANYVMPLLLVLKPAFVDNRHESSFRYLVLKLSRFQYHTGSYCSEWKVSMSTMIIVASDEDVIVPLCIVSRYVM